MATKYIAARSLIGGLNGSLDNVVTVVEGLVPEETIALVWATTGHYSYLLKEAIDASDRSTNYAEDGDAIIHEDASTTRYWSLRHKAV